MQLDAQTIDRIVAGVLNQLSANGDGAPGGFTTEAPRRGGTAEQQFSRAAMPSSPDVGSIVINANVVTADVLLDGSNGVDHVVVPKRAIVTPAAWDAAKERRIRISRDEGRAVNYAGDENLTDQRDSQRPSVSGPLAIVVRHTEAVGRLVDDMNDRLRRELLGCPDDAAALAISAICRGDATAVMILAEQTHRAACLANRNERIKAVAISDVGEVKSVRSQLRANVWCVDPTGRSWFELRNLVRAIMAADGA